MGWREEYNSKVTTFEEAAKLVKSGDEVTKGFGPAAPSSAFYEVLTDRWEELNDVRVVDA